MTSFPRLSKPPSPRMMRQSIKKLAKDVGAKGALFGCVPSFA